MLLSGCVAAAFSPGPGVDRLADLAAEAAVLDGYDDEIGGRTLVCCSSS